tara:strand:+ start:396496 stop:397332 length:837 start_codon:yes stop_codon:yes gene_type:complete
MTMAAMVIANNPMPDTALGPLANCLALIKKTALFQIGTGPSFFTSALYRERYVKIGSSTVYPAGFLFGFGDGFAANAVACRAVLILRHQVKRAIAAAAAIKAFHARNFRIKGFTGLGTRGLGHRDHGAGIFVTIISVKQRRRFIGFGLRHCDGRCRTSDQKQARDGERDFTAFVLCHLHVSLCVVEFVLLMISLSVGRDVSRAPLIHKLQTHCARKRDQLCSFLVHSGRKRSQLSENAEIRHQNLMNASQGNHLRRVAETDGLAYVRRNPILDGDTAR